MRTLEVWLEDELVGHIKETRKGGKFAYTSEIAATQTGIPLLSLSLPIKNRSYSESKTQNWFDGLLPEGSRRQVISRSLGLSDYDWIGLLAEIGWECAGAVKIFEEGSAKVHQSFYEPISKQELAHQLADISARMPQRNTEAFRMSLGGFQEKMCVMLPALPDKTAFIDGDGAFTPMGDAPSTHILKPENTAAYPGSIESEAWAMSVARSAARCSRAAVLRIEGAPDALVVERYDRTRNGDTIFRIHQEDACQALGLSSSHKYATQREIKGDDPTYRAMAGLLMTYAKNPLEEMSELLRQLVVNFVLGNWDAHAKNISFLLANSTPTVAPMYDIVPIVEVEKRTSLLSLRIDGTLDPAAISRSNIISEGVNWGLSPTGAASVVDKALEDIEEGLREAAFLYPVASKRHHDGALRRAERLV